MALTPSADDAQHALDALAERGERGLDGGAPGLLLLHRDALPVGLAPLGDVLVRRHPAAALERRVDDGDVAALVLAHVGDGLALGDAAQQVGDVLIGIAGEGAGSMRCCSISRSEAARLRQPRRQVVHLDVAPVAQDQLAGSSTTCTGPAPCCRARW